MYFLCGTVRYGAVQRTQSGGGRRGGGGAAAGGGVEWWGYCACVCVGALSAICQGRGGGGTLQAATPRCMAWRGVAWHGTRETQRAAQPQSSGQRQASRSGSWQGHMASATTSPRCSHVRAPKQTHTKLCEHAHTHTARARMGHAACRAVPRPGAGRPTTHQLGDGVPDLVPGGDGGRAGGGEGVCVQQEARTSVSAAMRAAPRLPARVVVAWLAGTAGGAGCMLPTSPPLPARCLGTPEAAPRLRPCTPATRPAAPAPSPATAPRLPTHFACSSLERPTRHLPPPPVNQCLPLHGSYQLLPLLLCR